MGAYAPMKKAEPRSSLALINASLLATLPEPSTAAGPSLFSVPFICFSMATDTRSCAPARRNEDRVIRPLVCCRRCKLRIVRFRICAKAHSLCCISSSGKIIRFCRSTVPAYFPRAISSRCLYSVVGVDSPYLSGIPPRVTVVLFLPQIPLVRAIGPGGGPGRRDKAPFRLLSGKPAQWDLLFSFCPFSRFFLHSLPFMYII